MAPAGVRVYVNPARDERFVASVDAAVATARDVVALQTELRSIYPRVIVQESAISAATPTWYVYREGAWVDEST